MCTFLLYPNKDDMGITSSPSLQGVLYCRKGRARMSAAQKAAKEVEKVAEKERKKAERQANFLVVLLRI